MADNDKIVFSIKNQDAIDRLRRDGKIELPKKELNIPKDMRWNEKNMASMVLRGLENGDSVQKISRSILPEIMSKTDFSGKTQQEIYGKGGIIDKNIQSSIRNARTMVTSAENHGRLDSYENLSNQGVVMKKEWEATPDDRVRPSHRDIDGEQQDIDKPFSNGCMYPGDGKGPAEEVWMCRCAMGSHIVGFKGNNGKVAYVGYPRDYTLHEEQMEKYARKTVSNIGYSETGVLVGNSVKTLNEKVYVEMANGIARLNKMLPDMEDFLRSSRSQLEYVSNAKEGVMFTDSKARSGMIIPRSININKKDADVFKSVKSLNEYVMSQQGSKYMPCSDSKAKYYLVSHEYGHAIQDYLLSIRHDWSKVAFDAMEDTYRAACEELRKEFIACGVRNKILSSETDIKGLSGYAIEQLGRGISSDVFSESFANMVCGKQNKWGKAMRVYLKEKGLM